MPVKPIFIVVFLLCAFAATAENKFEIPRSNIVEIKDPLSGRIYPLFVKLPRSYAANSNKAYPVIYLTDAMYSFQVVSGATRFAMNSAKMDEAIIVGISYSKGSRGPSSRVRDYTHQVAPNWKLETGKAQAHAQFIKKSVFGYLNKHYRVSGSRTFVGNSLGGLFGAYILFTDPTMFDNYVLGSPSTWYKNNDILNIKITPSLRSHKVYIGVGEYETPEFDSADHDMVLGAKQLKLKLSAPLLPHIQVRLNVIPGASHETAFPTTATQGLYWIFKK